MGICVGEEEEEEMERDSCRQSFNCTQRVWRRVSNYIFCILSCSRGVCERLRSSEQELETPIYNII